MNVKSIVEKLTEEQCINPGFLAKWRGKTWKVTAILERTCVVEDLLDISIKTVANQEQVIPIEKIKIDKRNYHEVRMMRSRNIGLWRGRIKQRMQQQSN